MYNVLTRAGLAAQFRAAHCMVRQFRRKMYADFNDVFPELDDAGTEEQLDMTMILAGCQGITERENTTETVRFLRELAQAMEDSQSEIYGVPH